MHELSIVSSIVESVTDTLNARPELLARGARVKAVRLRVGALASVIQESLEFCYGIATEGTPLAGSALIVDVLPVAAWCTACNQLVELPSLQSFRCPQCHAPVDDIRQGRELDIDSIEIEDPEEATAQQRF